MGYCKSLELDSEPVIYRCFLTSFMYLINKLLCEFVNFNFLRILSHFELKKEMFKSYLREIRIAWSLR